MTGYAGLAGIAAGICLTLEFSLFMLSGFAPDTFAEPDNALAFLRVRGGYLRAAVLVGAVGAALTTIFLAGVAARLRDAAPTRAAATLYFGIIGGAGHGLVALTFWVAIPLLIGLAAREPTLAAAGVGSLTLFTSGAEAFGNLFLALSMGAAGWTIVSFRILPMAVGWTGLAAAAFTVARIVGAETPLAFAAFFPSLVGAVIFRVWAGNSLRSLTSSRDGERADGSVPAREQATT